MDEKIQDFIEYFPLNIQSDKYFIHHFKHFNKCIEEELYASAYPHLHILYMLFVYVNILRIAKKKATEFELCWVGFPNQEDVFLKNPNSPFSFSRIPEKTVFRFFRVVGFNKDHISLISSVVNERNDYLHADGEVYFKNAKEFEKKLNSYLQKMKVIIKKQLPFLKEIYTLKTDQYEEDFMMTPHEIELNFSNSEDFFSSQELKLLAHNKRDIVSRFIIDDTNQQLDHIPKPPLYPNNIVEK